MPSGRRPFSALILAGLTVLALVPFAGKAFHIDDPLFLWAAQHIRVAPQDPYGFIVNWYGVSNRMSDVTKNPPLTSYYIAAISSMFGSGEWALHLAFLIPAIAVVLGTYLLACRWCAQPFLATLFTLITPVFLVSSSTIMCDTMMLALWVFAIHFWLTGLERRSGVRLALSGLLVALCALTKYFGMTLIPLLLLYSILKQRRVRWHTAYLLIPAIILGGYQWVTYHLYGRGLLLDAASYASEMSSPWGKRSLGKLLIGMAFTGGCLGLVWVFALRPWQLRRLLAGAAVAGTIMTVVAGAGGIEGHAVVGEGGNLWWTAALLGVFAAGGLSVIALAITGSAKWRDPETQLLGLWVLGTFVFASMVNWTTNGRSILPMVPAAGILILRHMEQAGRGAKRPGAWQTAAGVACAAALALGVAWADTAYANSARQAARVIDGKYRDMTKRLMFEGHWGFQYYMEALGAHAIDAKKYELTPGDIIVIPEKNTSVIPLPRSWVTLLERLEVPSSRWIATMRVDLGAGFYADTFGPLPYAIGAVPTECYLIFRVTHP